MPERVRCNKCGQMAYVINGQFRCKTCESNWVTTEQDNRSSHHPAPATSPSNKDTSQYRSSIKDTKVIHEGHGMGHFDPYHTWLGIAPSEQPANHYRLLGINLFENNSDVIENAADRQMAHIKTVSLGDNRIAAQKVLNKISAAKVCLLVPEKKYLYDEEIRETQNTSSAPPPLPPTFQKPVSRSPNSASKPQVSLPDEYKRRPPQRNQITRLIFVVGGGVLGIAIAASITSYIKQNTSEQAISNQGHKPNTKATGSASPAIATKPKKENDDLSSIKGFSGRKPKPKSNRLKPEEFFPSDKGTVNVPPKTQPAKKPTQVAKASTPSVQELQQARIDKLIETLRSDPNVNNRVNATNQLSTLGPDATKALPIFTKALLEDVSEKVQGAVLRAISQIGQNAKNEIPALTKYLDAQSNTELRKQTVTTMIAINPEAPQLHKILTRALTGTNSGSRMRMTDNTDIVNSRLWACQTIASMNQSGEWAVSMLKDLLRSSGRTLDDYKTGIDQFTAAASALGQIGVRLQGVEPLLKSLKDGKGVRTKSDDLKSRATLAADSALRMIQQQ